MLEAESARRNRGHPESTRCDIPGEESSSKAVLLPQSSADIAAATRGALREPRWLSLAAPVVRVWQAGTRRMLDTTSTAFSNPMSKTASSTNDEKHQIQCRRRAGQTPTRACGQEILQPRLKTAQEPVQRLHADATLDDGPSWTGSLSRASCVAVLPPILSVASGHGHLPPV